jgi:DNA-binding PucR family transcriptional regulator
MRPLDRFLPQSEVNLFAKIFEAGDAPRLARFLTEILAPIAARAPRQQAQLKLTLLRFFENQYSVKRTAEMLGLHINTIRQRLQLLRDIIGGWDDPVRALELQVALRLDALVTGRDDPG